MMIRRLIASLLIVMLSLSGATRALASPRGEQVQLTPEEEREARELAVRFVKRLHETNDFDALTSEFLPGDFTERIKNLIRGGSPDNELFFLCDREVLLQADARDLRRAYVALMDFWNQQELLGDAAWEHVKVEYKIADKDAAQEQGAWSQSLKLAEDSVPEEAFRIAQSDLLLDSLFNFIRHDDGSNDDEKSDDYEARIKAAGIHSVARLRALIDKLEHCIPLLRKGIEKLRSETATLRTVHCVEKTPEEIKKDSADALHVYHLESKTLDAETFGLPRGALLICARIYPYEMLMTRVDGRLRIIAVYPDFDGD